VEVGDGQVMDLPLLKAKAIHSTYEPISLPKAICTDNLVRNIPNMEYPHIVTTETSQSSTIHHSKVILAPYACTCSNLRNATDLNLEKAKIVQSIPD